MIAIWKMNYLHAVESNGFVAKSISPRCVQYFVLHNVALLPIYGRWFHPTLPVHPFNCLWFLGETYLSPGTLRVHLQSHLGCNRVAAVMRIRFWDIRFRISELYFPKILEKRTFSVITIIRRWEPFKTHIFSVRFSVKIRRNLTYLLLSSFNVTL